MRIRKNAKLSPLLHTCSSSLLQNGSIPVQTFQPHICRLNRSPWDVIPFASNNSSIDQFADEDGFKNGDSFGALGESVASMVETEDVVDIDNKHATAIENFDMMVLNDNQQRGNKKVVNNKSRGNKGLKRNLNAGGSGKEAPPRRGRGRPKKWAGSGSSSNYNNEFYFYSGFRPSWGKQQRGDKNEGKDNKSAITLDTSSDDKVNVGDNVKVNVAGGVDVNVAPCYSEGLDYVEDDEDDDDDDYGDNDYGKKRMRKPVKERSLKLLM